MVFKLLIGFFIIKVRNSFKFFKKIQEILFFTNWNKHIIFRKKYVSWKSFVNSKKNIQLLKLHSIVNPNLVSPKKYQINVKRKIHFKSKMQKQKFIKNLFLLEKHLKIYKSYNLKPINIKQMTKPIYKNKFKIFNRESYFIKIKIKN